MPSVVDSHTQCCLFADDCPLHRVVDSLVNQLQLQQDLAALEAWASNWGMQFNANKCHVKVVNKGQSHRPFLYQLCGTILDSVTRDKYFGVVPSQEMSWSPHIGNIVAKAHLLNPIQEIVFNLFIYSFIFYCGYCGIQSSYFFSVAILSVVSLLVFSLCLGPLYWRYYLAHMLLVGFGFHVIFSSLVYFF